jgi:hypothetical protein
VYTSPFGATARSRYLRRPKYPSRPPVALKMSIRWAASAATKTSPHFSAAVAAAGNPQSARQAAAAATLAHILPLDIPSRSSRAQKRDLTPAV